MASAVERFREEALRLGLSLKILEFPEGTRTAAEAAEAVGSDIGQIVKSLVFMADGEPVLALAEVSDPSAFGVVEMKDGKVVKQMGSAVVDTNGDLRPDTRLPGTSNFTAGIPPEGIRSITAAECYCVCHDDESEYHCTATGGSNCANIVCNRFALVAAEKAAQSLVELHSTGALPAEYQVEALPRLRTLIELLNERIAEMCNRVWW